MRVISCCSRSVRRKECASATLVAHDFADDQSSVRSQRRTVRTDFEAAAAASKREESETRGGRKEFARARAVVTFFCLYGPRRWFLLPGSSDSWMVLIVFSGASAAASISMQGRIAARHSDSSVWTAVAVRSAQAGNARWKSGRIVAREEK